MIKCLILLISLSAPLSAFAVCEAGQLTSLTSAVDFQRREANGNVLKVTLGAGSGVHIIAIKGGKIELLATAEFQGKQLSVLGDIESADSKVLSCAK